MVTPAIVPIMELPCADFRQRFNSRDVRFAPRKLSRPQNRLLRRDVILSFYPNKCACGNLGPQRERVFQLKRALTPFRSRKLAPQQALFIISASEK
jgi:hypothetical protein